MASDIGAEVGQKMRSAIKAKLLELNCYVDDELPDYIMVMVANKRTKTQMKEDLQLFLNNKTSTFVDWLYIVLKKLKEVTVTNPADVYKKSTTKRKVDDIPNIPLKKEKKDKKKIKEEVNNKEEKSLTDDLPINANKLSEQRKIIVMRENQQNPEVDNFDIPLLSEVNMSTEEELEDIEQKIKTVKSRLGLLVKSDDEQEEEEEEEETATTKKEEKDKTKEKSKATLKKSERTPITYDREESPKRRSILERLGKRKSQESAEVSSSSSSSGTGKRPRIDLSELRKQVSKSSKENKKKEGILSRLGVMSKVSIPIKEKEKLKKKVEEEEDVEVEEEEPLKNREVASVVKVKPRVIPDGPQPNKNLLLKAVAEAQRSIAQTPTVGSSKPDALFTKRYKEKLEETRKIPQAEKNKIKKILTAASDVVEYIPTPIQNEDVPKYIPTQKNSNDDDDDADEDTSENGRIKIKYTNENKPSIKSRLDKKRSPSPIIFDKGSTSVKNKSNIPDKLPVVHPPPSLKNKERCKYWPTCRQGDKCEFVHPTANCEMFPHCKFGDKCLYLHPSCKFGSSCTRRDCSYSHISLKTSRLAPVSTKPTLQTCKYFPNCTNINCTFYHPKLCKFGQFCKNQPECNFTHTTPSKSSLTWRSK